MKVDSFHEDDLAKQRFERIRSRIDQIGRQCAATMGRRNPEDVRDVVQNAEKAAWEVLRACPRATWEHIQKRVHLRVLNPRKRRKGTAGRASNAEPQLVPSSEDHTAVVHRDAPEDRAVTCSPRSSYVELEEVPDQDTPEDLVVASDPRVLAQRHFERVTHIKLGSFDGTTSPPFRRFRDSEGEIVCEWKARPGCDERIIDAIVPYLMARAATPLAPQRIRAVLLNGALGRPLDGFCLRDAVARAGIGAVSSAGLPAAGGKCRTVAETCRVRQAELRRFETWLKGLPAAVADAKGARRNRIERLAAAAEAIGAVAADPELLRRLGSCWGLDEVLGLVRWAGRLEHEVVHWRQEAAGGKPDRDFRLMVAGLRRVRYGDESKPLSDLLVAEALFALGVDNRSPWPASARRLANGRKHSMGPLESAVRDARRPPRAQRSTGGAKARRNS